MSSSSAPTKETYPEFAPFATWIGITVVNEGAGRSLLVLNPRPELVNRRGVLHGGVLATLLDSSMARAARTTEGVQDLAGTTDLHVQYMRPAQGPLQAEGWVQHSATATAFCRAEVRNAQGDLVASGSASLRIRR